MTEGDAPRIRPASSRLVAFMEDPDNEDIANPIHSTGIARAHGFQGALVGGATAYGWTAATLLDALDTEWLDRGWVHLKFVQPIYPGDSIEVSIAADGEYRLERERGLCIGGEAGHGTAPWIAELEANEFEPGQPAKGARPGLVLENAPVGEKLRPMSVPVSAEDARTYSRERERETLGLFVGAAPRVHIGWIAEQLIHLLHHSYDYGPSIHAQSHIQHLAPLVAGQTFTVTGRCHAAYERGGHHYIENDGAIWSERREELVRLRHTSVFHIAKR